MKKRCNFYLLVFVEFISWKNEFPQSAPLLLGSVKQVVFFLPSGRDSQAKRAGIMSIRKNAVTASHYARTQKCKNSTTKSGVNQKRDPNKIKIRELFVRWQLVLLLLSPVALCCQSVKEEGVVSSFCLYFFFSPLPLASGDCSHGRTGLDLRWSERPLPLALSWNGHGQFTWRHTSRDAACLMNNERLLFMRHAHSRLCTLDSSCEFIYF